MSKIIIGADFVPTNRNESFFINGAAEPLLTKNLYEFIVNSQYKIFNLEMPLCKVANPIEKNGPCLLAKEETVALYKKLNINLLSIANNHILDQGEDNLLNTIKVLEKNNIDYVGAGINLNKLKKTHVFNLDNKKIGIYSCCEHEFSVATETSAGANPFDPFYSFDDIVKLKMNCDYLIVLFHGGKEEYRYPTPLLQKTCKRFIDKGADLVICQHSHCIGCEENYKDCKIVYGQGNFLFDLCDEKCWQTNLLVEIDCTNNFSIRYIPCVKNKERVRLANKSESYEILTNFYERSNKIKEDNFVEKNYKKLASKFLNILTINFGGRFTKNIFFRVINKLMNHNANKLMFRKKDYLAIKNMIDCETHREGMLMALEQVLKKNNDV